MGIRRLPEIPPLIITIEGTTYEAEQVGKEIWDRLTRLGYSGSFTYRNHTESTSRVDSVGSIQVKVK
jgi:hypothetical protein